MVHAARASAPRAATPPSTRQFLIGRTAIRIARNSPENNALNFSNRSKIACFGAHFAAHNRPFTTQESVVLRSHPDFPQFLIATRPGLEIELTPSQQTRKHFLIASFSAISAAAPHLNIGRREFPIATDQTEKIANHMKRNEKRFSNRNKIALGSIGTILPVLFGFGLCCCCEIQGRSGAHRQDCLCYPRRFTTPRLAYAT
jgi:hypothetical protein